MVLYNYCHQGRPLDLQDKSSGECLHFGVVFLKQRMLSKSDWESVVGRGPQWKFGKIVGLVRIPLLLLSPVSLTCQLTKMYGLVHKSKIMIGPFPFDIHFSLLEYRCWHHLWVFFRDIYLYSGPGDVEGRFLSFFHSPFQYKWYSHCYLRINLQSIFRR